MPPKRPLSPAPISIPSEVHTSQPLHDRSSHFKGYFTASTHAPLDVLRGLPEAESATHRIVAWRLPSTQRSLTGLPRFETGHDDDGEQWAGRHVEKVLGDLDVVGACMVARWYGGELLGPIRFRHVESVARGAVEAWRRREGVEEGSSQKRGKVGGDVGEGKGAFLEPQELARRRREVLETLRARDESISTLRKLLEQKQQSLALVLGQPASPSAAAKAPEAKKTYYENMPFKQLQTLEQARDSSIGFLLKKIDAVEAEIAEASEEIVDAELEEAVAIPEQANGHTTAAIARPTSQNLPTTVDGSDSAKLQALAPADASMATHAANCNAHGRQDAAF